ncbi:MAG: hypothetical protein OXR73_09235, partial [Myxococcales bacterium]|nr:hypothetical protein [Myxococcales bacterium]
SSARRGGWRFVMVSFGSHACSICLEAKALRGRVVVSKRVFVRECGYVMKPNARCDAGEVS